MGEITFEQAIREAQALLDREAKGQLDQEELGRQVEKLVATSNGARGFFVTFLPGAWPIADAVPEAILAALRTSPTLVSELMTKNLAMSTAMIWTHTSRGDAEAAEGSAQVARRSAALIRQLDLDELKLQLTALRQSLGGDGDYAAFLKRWGYGDEQRRAIGEALAELEPP